MNLARPAKYYYEDDLSTSSEINPCLSGFCTYVLENLPTLMNEETVLGYLYGGMETQPGDEGYESELFKIVQARRILDNYHTAIGWRNFLYVLTQLCGVIRTGLIQEEQKRCMQENIPYKESTIREHIEAYSLDRMVGNYVADSEMARVNSKKDSIHLYATIIMGSSLVYSEKDGRGRWYKYSDGCWIVVGREYVSSRLARHVVSNFCLEMGTGISYRCELQTLEALLAIPNFYESLDKENILSMPTSTFERANLCTRSRLPGDLNTMQMGFDVESYEEYGRKCMPMLEILDEYFGGDRETTIFLLDCLTMAATGKFSARWATLMYGTGSDGKSTLIKIAQLVFGSYSTSSAASLFSRESNDPNAPTPALEATISKLLVVIPDLGKHYIVGGSVFMQKTGEDDVFTRALYGRGGNDRSKPYILMACDQLSGPRKLSELARIKAIFMTNKKATSEDIEVFNAHLAKQYKPGQNSYGDKFAKEYGSTLMTYLLMNMSKVSKNNIVIPHKVREDTKSWSNKNPVGAFCNRFLDRLNEKQGEEAKRLKQLYPDPKSEWSIHDTMGIIMPSVGILFAMWKAWIKMARDSSQGITNIEEFKGALSLFQSIKERKVQGGSTDFYVPNKVITVRQEDLRVMDFMDLGNYGDMGMGMGMNMGIGMGMPMPMIGYGPTPGVGGYPAPGNPVAYIPPNSSYGRM